MVRPLALIMLWFTVARPGHVVAYTRELLYDTTETLLGIPTFREVVMLRLVNVTILPLQTTVAGRLENVSRCPAVL